MISRTILGKKNFFFVGVQLCSTSSFDFFFTFKATTAGQILSFFIAC